MSRNSRLFSTTTSLKLIDSTFANNIEFGNFHQPRAYVEIVDTDSSITTLTSCSSFNITESRDSMVGDFSCTIEQANLWNPRTASYTDLLYIDTRKRIKIYYGRMFNGTIKYVQMFNGILTESPESYNFGGQNRIALKGKNISYLLSKNYSDSQIAQTFTGTGKTLLQQWLDYAEIEYSLSYNDTISMSAKSISYSTALAGVQALKDVYGPGKELFIDGTGFLTFRDVPDWNADDVEFSYDQTNIMSIDRGLKIDEVPTIINVTGDSDTNSYTYTASSEILNQYGRNTKSLTSGLINSPTMAESLANDIFDDGQDQINNVQISVILNPYLTVGSNVTIEDSSLSSTSESQLRINELTHHYVSGSNHETVIKGVLES